MSEIYQQTGASDAAIGVSGGNIIGALGKDEAIGISGSVGTSIARDGGIVLGQGAVLKNGFEVPNNTGTVNIGEQGLGQIFADTVDKLTDKITGTGSTSESNGLPDPSTDLEPDESEAETTGKLDKKTIIGSVAGLIALLLLGWVLRKD